MVDDDDGVWLADVVGIVAIEEGLAVTIEEARIVDEFSRLEVAEGTIEELSKSDVAEGITDELLVTRDEEEITEELSKADVAEGRNVELATRAEVEEAEAMLDAT